MELTEMQIQMMTGKMVHLLYPLLQGAFPEEDQMEVDGMMNENEGNFTSEFLRKSIACYNKNPDFKTFVDDSVDMFVYAINVTGSIGSEVDPFLIITNGDEL
jgi:hypothetical protein